MTATSAKILDGKALSQSVRAELKERVDRLRAKGVVPRLDVLVAIQDPSSRALALAHIASAKAEAGDVLGAFQVVAKIQDLGLGLDHFQDRAVVGADHARTTFFHEFLHSRPASKSG